MPEALYKVEVSAHELEAETIFIKELDSQEFPPAIQIMSSVAARSRYDRAVVAGRAMPVPMGRVRCLVFTPQLSAIGTKDLGACSVVTITSPEAAILAHIPPLPAATTDPQAGDRLVRAMMEQVLALYNGHKSKFPAANTYIICAAFQGRVGLPDQQRIMMERVRSLNISVRCLYYPVPVNTTRLGHGTVLIDSSERRGLMPAVYVEDNLVPGT